MIPIILLLVTVFISVSFAQRDLETINDEEDLRQFIYQTAPSEDAYIAVQRLAKPYIDKRDYKTAAGIFLKYREWFTDKYDRFDRIIEMLNSPQQNLDITNIETVNTRYDEYFPVLTIDGRYMYFTYSGKKDRGEDIYFSQLVGDTWIKPAKMGRPFSTDENDAVNSISADGNIIVIFGSYKPHQGGGDNYYAERTEKGWSNIKPFPKPLNSPYWECDGFLTADGKAFLFSSDRPGNVGEFVPGGQFFHGGYEGNTDIWVSERTPDGAWCKPVNLGNVINTPFSERSPFLHPDGRTLYFSSDGHYGLGSLDVFKSVRLSDTSWTEWSEPVNLGKEINTAGLDIAYKITTDGKFAFFASDREGGKGGYDIYRLKLPPEAKPVKNVVTVKGKITDEFLKPLNSKISWFDLENGKEVGSLSSNPQTGEYIITIPVGKLYSYFAEKDGYYSVSNRVDLTDTVAEEMIVDIIMYSLSALENSSVVLNNIYFDIDKWELKPESYVELERVYEFLNVNSSVKIEISAHTDSRGSEEYNMTLSQKRAESVVNYLLSRGISAERMIARGYGESYPVVPNDTEENMALNRRVEMKVIR